MHLDPHYCQVATEPGDPPHYRNFEVKVCIPTRGLVNLFRGLANLFRGLEGAILFRGFEGANLLRGLEGLRVERLGEGINSYFFFKAPV